jgi:hypoxanthine-guanine phosphoribosyltransferase
MRAEEHLLYGPDRIDAVISEHALALASYARSAAPILVLGVCEGGLYYTKRIEKHPIIAPLSQNGDIEFSYIKTSRYSGQSALQKLSIAGLERCAVTGRRVVVTEDMIDGGVTLLGLAAELTARGAHEVNVLTLVSRYDPKVKVPCLSLLADPLILEKDFPHSRPWIFGCGPDFGLDEQGADEILQSRYRAIYLPCDGTTPQLRPAIVAFTSSMNEKDLSK